RPSAAQPAAAAGLAGPGVEPAVGHLVVGQPDLRHPGRGGRHLAAAPATGDRRRPVPPACGAALRRAVRRGPGRVQRPGGVGGDPALGAAARRDHLRAAAHRLRPAAHDDRRVAVPGPRVDRHRPGPGAADPGAAPALRAGPRRGGRAARAGAGDRGAGGAGLRLGHRHRRARPPSRREGHLV
ncbi:MAG: Na(+) H(+) antiporter subunit E, partial [uncultured Blastococcus sp.]